MDLRLAKEKFSDESQARVREALHLQHKMQEVSGKLFTAKLQARKFPGTGWEEKITVLESELKEAVKARDSVKAELNRRMF